MGSGKTYHGKKLAEVLGFDFIDTDEKIEILTGKTIKDLFEVYGEAYFRKCEYDLLQTFSKNQDAVVSTGGGMPCKDFNLSLMKKTGMVIYLKPSITLLKERLSSNKNERPLLKDISRKGLKTFIEEKLSQREAYYNQAHLVYSFTDEDEPFAKEMGAYIQQFV